MKKLLSIVVIILISNSAYSGWFSSEGKLRISSDQEGAEIFIDQIKKAETGNGYTTITLPEGDHIIRIFKEYDEWHFLEAEKKVFIGKDTVTEISMRLQKRMTVAGIERERKKQKQLEYENELYISGEYKQYLKECEFCQYSNKAKRKNDDFLYQAYSNKKSLKNANSYLNNCITCNSKDKIKNNLAFIKDLEDNYIINNDATITNKNLKITWMRCKLGTKWKRNRNGNYSCDLSYGRPKNAYYFQWDYIDKAINQINNKGFANQKDWRLPTFQELNSLVFCKTGKISKKTPFCNKDNYRAYNELAFPRLADKSDETLFWSKKDSNGEVKSINFSSVKNYNNSILGKSIGTGDIKNRTVNKKGWDRFNFILLVRNDEKTITNNNPKQSSLTEVKTSKGLIPIKFQGRWDKDNKSCLSDEAGDGINISPTEISYSTTGGRVKKIKKNNSNSIGLVLSMYANEREDEWISVTKFNLKNDSLIIKHGEATKAKTYIKCK